MMPLLVKTSLRFRKPTDFSIVQPVPLSGRRQDDAAFGSPILDIVPLPQIPEVSGTLRRDLAHFRPLTLIYNEESQDMSEVSPFLA